MARSLSVSHCFERGWPRWPVGVSGRLQPDAQRPASSTSVPRHCTGARLVRLPRDDHAQEMVIFALGLLDTGYRFGGKNPEAGLDCSGMVSYVVEQVSGKRPPYNAAGIAERTRPIPSNAVRPGDLVFFNTPRPLVFAWGFYVGDGKSSKYAPTAAARCGWIASTTAITPIASRGRPALPEG